MSIEIFVKYYLYGLQTLIDLKKQSNMKLQMQYTYKGTCVSMIGEYTNKLSRTTCKNTIVICHNSNKNWKNLDAYNYITTWYTQLQGIKKFMKIVHELNEGIINIKTT